MTQSARTESKTHGVDCKSLGSRYASALLGNSKTQVAELPELQRHPVYQKLNTEQQADVRIDIKFIARDLLILAGNSPAVVERIIAKK